MTNYIQEGDTVTATAPYAVNSGQGALIGTMFGVATADVANGAEGEFVTKGVFDLTRETGAGTAWTEGAAIYWDDTNKRVTKTSTSNTKIGVGILPLPADGDATGRVRLNGAF
jgi:predicted RecA/RadA family phage recombinase